MREKRSIHAFSKGIRANGNSLIQVWNRGRPIPFSVTTIVTLSEFPNKL